MTDIGGQSAVVRASQLVTWLVREKVIARNWIDHLDLLDASKFESTSTGIESIMDEKAREFLITNQSQMMYTECQQLVEMMSSGVDGQNKTLFTRKYKSVDLLSWLSILKTYEDQRLFIAEKLRSFKLASREIVSVRKQISDFGLRLAELDPKRHACEIESRTVEEKLIFMRTKFHITDTVDPASAIEAFFKDDYQRRSREATKLMQSPVILEQWEDYCSHFPYFEKPCTSLNLFQYRLIMEELTAFLQASGNDLASEFSKVRDSIADALCYDFADSARKAIAEYNRLCSTLREDKVGRRILDIETRIRAEISRSNERLAELTETRKILLIEIKRDIETVTGKQVDILDD